ncbi:MAG: hypothetical protein ACLP22_25440 [Solirubrobacteraceae bacterium]
MSHAAAGTAASAAPPGGAPPGGSSTPTYTDTGAYTLAGGRSTLQNRSFKASGTDESGVLVSSSGDLTLLDPTVRTTGSSKSSDESSFYGLDAGVLAESSGVLDINSGSILTTGAGANGVFAYGSGASVTLRNVKITATGQYAHGVMASGGGTISVTGATVSTAGASSAAVATDRGGGTITVNGGSFRTSGFKSPGIYSTGTIKVTGAAMTATGAEAAVVEGANSITATRSTLRGAAAGAHGVMLYNSMSGDANAGTGTYTMLGGSLSAAGGPAFYVTNTDAVITISGRANISAASGVLLRADNAGTGSGNTGAGNATLVLRGEHLTGDLLSGGTGTIRASLSHGTVLEGRIDAAALTIDGSSVWKVTGNSTLSGFLDSARISGSDITNVIGDGHTVTYDAALVANKALGGRTYRLAGGGELKPA